MNLKFVLLMVGIVSMFLVPGALASKVDVTLKETGSSQIIDNNNPFSTCPFPITPQHVSMYVENIGSSSDTYSIEFTSLPTDWTGSIQEDITLASGEEKKVDLFLINMPAPNSLFPGMYEVGIKVKSISSGHSAETILPVDILACYAVLVKPVKATQEMCKETTQSLEYNIEVENKGKFDETYSLESSVSWVSFSEDKVTVLKGKKETVVMTVTPPETVTGKQTVDITAKSLESYASGKSDVTIDIKECFDFSASLTPSKIDTCYGDKAEYTLKINNIGEKDTFIINSASNVKPSLSKVTLDAGKTDSLDIVVTPDKVGSTKFDVEIISENTDKIQKVSGTVEAEECRGIAVIMSPSEKTSCAGEEIEYTVTLKNTGKIKETFSLTSNKGSLDKEKVTLDADQTKTVKLTVKGQEIVYEDIVTVTAYSEDISDSANTILTVENCYDADLSIIPEKLEVCPCSTIDYTVTLENKGKLADTYKLEYSDTIEDVKLDAGKKKEVSFTVKVSCDQTGSYEIKAKAKSDFMDLSAVSDMTVKNKETCFGMEMSNGKGASVDVYEGIVVPIKVENTGEVYQEFNLESDGPSWVYISPETLELLGGENGVLYLYASPTFGTEEGKYNVMITGTSDYIEVDYELTITVGEEGDVIDVKGEEEIIEEPEETTEEETTETEEPEETTEETTEEETGATTEEENDSVTISVGDGVTLSVTFENETDGAEVTGDLVADDKIPSFKTIAIGVITIIIIVILVIRFAILVKK